MNDIESRLQRYREQALAEIGAYGGVERAVEKTASMEDSAYEKTASLLDDLDAVSSFLRDGGEIEKISSYRRDGEQPMVGYSPAMENRLREPRSLGAAHTKEKTRPLQRTPGGSPTAVTRTEGKDEPSKTASIEELRDQILSQFGVPSQARGEGQEKTAGPKMDAVADFFRQFVHTAKKSATDPVATLKSVADVGDVASVAGMPTAAGHAAGATVPAAALAGLLAAGANATAKRVAKGRKFSNIVSKGKNWASPLESAGKALDHAKSGRYGAAVGYATPLAAYTAGGGLGAYGLAKALGRNKKEEEGMDKEAAYDFPGGVETYSGKEGPTLSGPGTEFISSNDRAIDYTKRDAKRLVVPSLRQEISEPAMSASTDPVAQRALSNASEAGVKMAGLAAGGIRGLLLGGER